MTVLSKQEELRDRTKKFALHFVSFLFFVISLARLKHEC